MPGLLGRDVVERADRGPVAGDLVLLGQVDRQPEVGQLGGAVAGDQDVVGVDVAVDQPLLLGVLQPQRDLPDQPGGGGRGDRAVLGDDRADVLALDVLHHEVALAVGLALVVDPDEVLVLELRPTRASRWNRAMARGLFIRSGERIFSATRRLSRVSLAR